MKKTISILMVFLLSFSIVQALEQPNVLVKNLPNQKLLYFIQTKIQEPLEIFLTFDKEKKIQKRLEQLERRRAELDEIVGLEDEKLTQKVEQLRLKQLKKIEDEEIFLSQNSRKDLEEILSKHVERLQVVLEKAPESAKSGLQNAIASSSKVLEKVRERNQIQEQVRNSAKHMLVEEEI